jgi:DNA invertase Pin-like site-specific DNA recombinase
VRRLKIVKIIAYLYSDPLWEMPPERSIWGWEVEKIYQDFNADRSQLRALLSECWHSPANFLLLRRLEELGDSLLEVSDRLSQLEHSGVCVLTTEQDYCSSGQADHLGLTTEQDSKHLQLLKLLQAIQSQQRSRKIRQGHARNRIKALPPPGKPPYGYRRGKERYVIDRKAAPVVKDFFEHFLLYGSLRGALRYLHKKHSKQISATTGQRWLTHPVYRGDLAYRQQQILRDTHAAILSREEAAQIDRLLRRNRSLAPRSASAPRSLAGLVICGACQSAMKISRVTAPRRSQEYLYLLPTACPQRPKCAALEYQTILTQTIEQICQDLPQAVAGVNVPMMGQLKADLEAKIAAKEQAIAQLPNLVTEEILDPQTAELRTYRLRTEIAQLQNQLTQFPPLNLQQIAQTITIPQFWLDLSESERRFYFREFIRQIHVLRLPDSSLSLQLIFMF